ncbi:MAG: hypothetical protein ABFR19_02290 [Pseudomonadota bacterium]
MSQGPASAEQSDKAKAASVVSRLLVMPLATAVLFLLAHSLLDSSCWILFFMAAIIAWPIWHYQQEYLLFQRRAILERATTADSDIRRLLWAGRLTRTLQVFVALAWAFVLLGFSALLKPQHWWLLAADVLLLALMVGPIRRRMAKQIREQQLGVLVRRWPLLLLNLLLLSVGFLLVDFFVVAVADTRDMAWYKVAETAFSEQFSMAACPLSGYLVGLLATGAQLTSHLSQIVIPKLPDVQLRLAAWGLFLLQAGIFAYAFSRFQLGIVALLDARKLRLETLTGKGSFSKAFVITILILAIPYLYAAFKLQGFDPQELQREAQRVLSWTNPCKPDQAALDQLGQQFDSDIESARADSKRDAGQRVNADLERLFTDVERGVDSYLDWYFTVIGEYERLAAVAAGDLAELMTDELESRLFTNNRFGERLASTNQVIATSIEQQMTAQYQRLGRQAAVSIETQPCGLGELDLSAFGDLERDQVRAATAAGGGAVIAVTSSKLLAKKAAAAVIGKVAAKKSFATATGLLGKASVKKGGSVLLSAAGGAAVCTPGGPVAALCGVVAGAVAWFTFDKVFIEIDEALFREEMRDDIIVVLKLQQAELAAALKAQHDAAIDAMVLDMQRSVDRLFLPSRDGL